MRSRISVGYKVAKDKYPNQSDHFWRASSDGTSALQIDEEKFVATSFVAN